MSPRRELRLVSALMVIGTLPLVLDLGWTAAVLFDPPRGDSGFFSLDPIAMVGVLMMTYAFAAIVGGFSALQSLALTRHYVELRSITVAILRVIVALALAAPPLCILGMQYKVR
jgi:hypothetical protein